MRALFPSPAEEVDLDAAYAYPQHGAWLRANMVASLDGAAWLHRVTEGLSGRADRRVFAVLRGLADVVLVGAATVRAEGYGPARPRPDRVAARRAAGLSDAPPIAVVTGALDLDLSAPFFTEWAERPLLLTTERAARERGPSAAKAAEVVVCGEARVDIGAAVRALHDRGLRQVLCEGGPHLLAEVAGAGLLDELDLTLAPLLVAGDASRVLAGPALAPPVALPVAAVLEEDGFLFLRCARPEPAR